MSITVNMINPQSITAWPISAETAGDVVDALNTIGPLGWKGTINSSPWMLILSRAGFKDTQSGGNGSWIVFDGTHVDVLTNAEFVAAYSYNVPLVWAATTTPPDAAPQSGLSVQIFTPAPTSANGPWTYSIRLVDSNGDATEYDNQPTVTNGQLAWTIGGLTATDYTGTITVATKYPGVEATSATFAFTATA